MIILNLIFKDKLIFEKELLVVEFRTLFTNSSLITIACEFGLRGRLEE